MPPAIYKHPIMRPAGFLSNARFEGSDDRLMFLVDYLNALGAPQTISFRLFDDPSPDFQEMCIPAANADITRIHDDALIAHMRMASMISDTVPTSQEWKDALIVVGTNQAKYFQTGVGQTRVVASSPVGDQMISATFQRGTTSNQKVVQIGYSEVSKDGYAYAPSTQLRVIPGSVLAQFSNGYKHDYPNGVILTTTERANIIAYVNGLQPWV